MVLSTRRRRGTAAPLKEQANGVYVLGVSAMASLLLLGACGDPDPPPPLHTDDTGWSWPTPSSPACDPWLGDGGGRRERIEDHRYATLIGEDQADGLGYNVDCADDLAGPLPRAWVGGAPEYEELGNGGWLYVVQGGTRGELTPDDAHLVVRGDPNEHDGLGFTTSLGSTSPTEAMVFSGYPASGRFEHLSGAAHAFAIDRSPATVLTEDAEWIFLPTPYSGTYHALPVGDLDDDGLAEVVVSRTFDRDFVTPGELALFRGADLTAINDSGSAAATFTDASTVNLTGRSLWAADINGDGHADLIHGEPQIVGYSDPGRVAIRLGPLLPTDPAPQPLGADIEIWSPEASETGDLGSHAAFGDLNDDGAVDLVLSDVTVELDGVERTGQAYVFLGPLDSGTSLVAEQADIIVDGYAYRGMLGHIAVGDHDGDGHDDLIVAQAPWYSGSGCPGRVHVFRGPMQAGHLHARDDADLLYDNDVPDTIFGLSMKACDLDGDGDDEIVIGEPGFSSEGEWGRGRVQVVEGWDFTSR